MPNARTLGGGKKFTPKSVPGLSLWLDASAPRAVSVDELEVIDTTAWSPMDINAYNNLYGWWDASFAGNQVVKLTGQLPRFLRLVDRSNSGMLGDLTGGTSSSQVYGPTATTLPGFAPITWAAFDGSSSSAWPLQALTGAQSGFPRHFLMVYWPYANVGPRRYFTLRDTDENEAAFALTTTNRVGLGWGINQAYTVSPTLPYANGPQILNIYLDAATDDAYARRNYNQGSAVDGTGGIATDVWDLVLGGKELPDGSWGERASFYFGELLMFQDPLSEADQRKLERYLAVKWGIDIIAPGVPAEDAIVPLVTPTSIPGCAMWLDADQSVTPSLFDATSGGNPVTQDGGTVARWEDKSGNGLHVMQATSARRPTFRATTFNGKSCLNGNRDRFLVSDPTSLNLQEATIICAYRIGTWQTGVAPTDTNPNLYHTDMPSSGSGNYGLRLEQGSQTLGVRVGNTSGSSVFYNAGLTSSHAGVASTHAARYTQAGVYTGRVSGGSVATGTVPSGNRPSEFGNRISVMSGFGSDGYLLADRAWIGDIAEFIVYGRALSDLEIARVEQYLAAKWSMSGVTNTAAPIANLKDLSGNGRNASQATESARPKLTTENGRRAISFAGSQSVATPSYVSSATTTYFYVGRHTDANEVYFQTGPINAYHSHIVEQSSHKLRRNEASPNGIVLSQNLGVNSLSVWSSAYANTSLDVRWNGAAVGRTPGTASNATTSTVSTSIGRFPSPDAGLYPLNGTICEFIAYNRSLSLPQRQRVERYLSAKWDVPIAPQVFTADAQDWIGRVYANGGTVTQSTADAVDRFCASINAAGLRDRFYRLSLICGSNLNAAVVPLYRAPTAYSGRNIVLNNANAVQFSGSGWANDFGSGTANQQKGALVAAPDGTLTAQTVTFANAGAIRHTPSWINSATGTVSLWARKPQVGGATHIRITTNNTTAWNTGVSEKFALTTSWQRFSVAGVLSNANSATHIIVGGNTVSGGSDADCNGIVELWSPQVEYGTLSDYEGPQYGNAIDAANAFVGVGTDYAETGPGGGLTGNGSSKYLNTGLSVSNIGTFSSGHLSVYHGQSSGTNVNRYLIAANDSNGSNRFWLGTDAFTTGSAISQHYGWNQVPGLVLSPNASVHPPAGHRMTSRLALGGSVGSDPAFAHYYNGQQISSSTQDVSAGAATSTAPFYVFARNGNGTAIAWHDSWIAAYSIGLGMTSTQAAAYRTAMQEFQTALGRNV